MALFAPTCRVSRRSHPFFPSFQQDFAPVIRMFDELENFGRSSVRAHQPKFDVREEKDSFHLQGELPGVDQKDINIEFVDPTTLLVRGRTVRERQSGTPPSGAALPIEAKPDQDTSDTSAFVEVEHPQSETSSNYQRPSIEEDRDEVDASTVGAPTPATTVAEPVKPAETTNAEQQTNKPVEDGSHYWMTERSIGDFQRTFNFPGQIDQDAVTASLKNGILSIVVPKQQPRQPKKIVVQ